MTENRTIYQEPEMEILMLDCKDVVTASGDTPEFDVDEGEGW